MRLYYFTAEQWGLKVLIERRIKVSQLDDLNDPFEMYGMSVPTPAERRAFKVLRTRVCKTIGVICLSEKWNCPVMWAHYADRHRGLCLGFDVIGSKGVYYSPRKLKRQLAPDTMNEEVMETLLLTKFKQWEYEGERRLIVPLLNKVGSNFFQAFGQDLVLRSVYIGSRCTLTAHDVARAISTFENRVTILGTRAAFTKFEVLRDARGRGGEAVVGADKE